MQALWWRLSYFYQILQFCIKLLALQVFASVMAKCSLLFNSRCTSAHYLGSRRCLDVNMGFTDDAWILLENLYIFNTHIFSHNYDNHVLHAKLYLVVKNSFLAYFVSRTILGVIDHMHEHFSPDLSPTTLWIPSHSPGLPGERPPCRWEL